MIIALMIIVLKDGDYYDSTHNNSTRINIDHDNRVLEIIEHL